MTYYVSSMTLNSKHSHSLARIRKRWDHGRMWVQEEAVWDSLILRSSSWFVVRMLNACTSCKHTRIVWVFCGDWLPPPSPIKLTGFAQIPQVPMSELPCSAATDCRRHHLSVIALLAFYQLTSVR